MEMKKDPAESNLLDVTTYLDSKPERKAVTDAPDWPGCQLTTEFVW